MQIIDFKNKKWIIGLEWEVLPGESSFKEEAKDAAAKTNNTFGLLLEHDQQFAIGLCKKAYKNPSAAMALALANQRFVENSSINEIYLDWIVVEDVGNDKYWLSVIKNGIPAPNYDMVLDITSIKEKINELLVNDTFKLYSTSPDIKTVFENVKLIEDVDFSSLVAEIEIKKSNFIKLKGIPNTIIVGILGLGVLSLLGYMAISIMEGRTLKEKAEAFEKQRKQEEIIKQQQYKKAMIKYEENKKEARNAAIKNITDDLSVEPKEVLGVWYDKIGSIEYKTHGWTLDKINCSVIIKDFTTECETKYKRVGLSTNRMLLEDYPKAIIKGDEAFLKEVFPLKKSKTVSEKDLNDLPTAKNFGFDMISQLQLMKIVGVNHQINASSEIEYDLPPKPLSPEEQKDPKKVKKSPKKESLGILGGEITVANNNFELLDEWANNVDFIGVGVKSSNLKIRGMGEINWEIKLNYYVRNDNSGGIGSSNSSALSSQSVENKTNKNE